jgi:hypothetical protein
MQHAGEPVDPLESGTPDERPAGASSSKWVKHCLERLDRLEVAQVNLSTAVNWAYYRLGEAWYDFCCVRIGLCSGLRIEVWCTVIAPVFSPLSPLYVCQESMSCPCHCCPPPLSLDHGLELSFHYLHSYFRLVTPHDAVYSARIFRGSL